MLTNEKSVKSVSNLGESPGVIFAVTAHGGARILHRALYKFTKFAIHNVKTRFLFLFASTSLDRNFDSCLSIRCLAPQQILQFFVSFLAQLLPLPSATVLIIASSSSMLHLAIEIKKKKKKKEGVADGLRFPGNLYISSLTPRGSIVPLFCGFRRRYNLLA